MKRAIAIAVMLAFAGGGLAHARKNDDDASDDDDDAPKKPPKKADKKKKPPPKADADEDSDDDKPAKKKKPAEDDDDKPAKKPAKPSEDDTEASDEETKPSSDEDSESTDTEDKGPNQQDKDVQKQDLNGHDLGTTKKENEFEKSRFYVDKADGDDTHKGTLVQGSIAASSFLYTESGGKLPGNATADIGSNAGKFSRYFEDLRLQTDFRHIGGGRWDMRLDARLRVVNNPGLGDPFSADATHVQSGFQGQNEYEIRELYVVRNGVQSDVVLGRQFVTDIGALKVDGLRIDYAQSRKVTLIGFGGLYPVRGSRSITTDYIELKDSSETPAGKIVGAGGFGAAYRTIDAYGSVGGFALAPFQAESPRVAATAQGYLRVSPQLDFYHFAIVDLLAQSGASVTAATAGINYKPNQRLRLTAAFNRVDTDALNVQAQAFLDKTDPSSAGNGAVQNETFIERLSTNSLRGGVSAALGELQRFELSVAGTFRYRPEVTLQPAIVTGMDAAAPIKLAPEKGVDLYASLVDRRSFKDARLGIDVIRTFGIGAVPYQRSEVLALRASAAHEVRDGRGEWEAEVSYATTKDVNAGAAGGCASLDTCFGSTSNTILSLGGNFYYRINSDWFTLASLSLNHQGITSLVNNVSTSDPGIVSLTGFFRIAYRF